MTSTTKIVQAYVNRHPSVKECLARGLINTSALAREICRVSRTNKHDAVDQACRRLRRRLTLQSSHEKLLVQLVKRAKVRIRHRMFVAVFGKPSTFDRLLDLHANIKRQRGDFTMIESEETVTIITNEEYASLVRTTFRSLLKKAVSDVAQVTLVFDRRIESTPGVMAHVYGLLRERKINVMEESSCWRDMMFVVAGDDLPETLDVLNEASG